MKNSSDIPEPNPDQFARDLHKALLLEGPRSSSVRGLMRIARKNPGAELERIFETKVAEYKRHHRETRVPTWTNAPLRALEWVTENASFTPPKDVLMTLVYVVIALLGVEFGKGFFGYDKSAPTSRADDAIRMQSPNWNYDSPSDEIPVPANDVERSVDDWIGNQMVQASQSPLVSSAIQSQVNTVLSDIKLDEVLKQEVDKLNLQKQLESGLKDYLESEQFQQQVTKAVADGVRKVLSDSSIRSDLEEAQSTVREIQSTAGAAIDDPAKKEITVDPSVAVDPAMSADPVAAADPVVATVPVVVIAAPGTEKVTEETTQGAP